MTNQQIYSKNSENDFNQKVEVELITQEDIVLNKYQWITHGGVGIHEDAPGLLKKEDMGKSMTLYRTTLVMATGSIKIDIYTKSRLSKITTSQIENLLLIYSIEEINENFIPKDTYYSWMIAEEKLLDDFMTIDEITNIFNNM